MHADMPQAGPAHAHCRHHVLDCRAAGAWVQQCPTGAQHGLCIMAADSQASPRWALQRPTTDRVCPAAWPEFASQCGQCLWQACDRMSATHVQQVLDALQARPGRLELPRSTQRVSAASSAVRSLDLTTCCGTRGQAPTDPQAASTVAAACQARAPRQAGAGSTQCCCAAAGTG